MQNFFLFNYTYSCTNIILEEKPKVTKVDFYDFFLENFSIV